MCVRFVLGFESSSCCLAFKTCAQIRRVSLLLAVKSTGELSLLFSFGAEVVNTLRKNVSVFTA